MLDNIQRQKGVIAASAGNHALALAYHGGLLSKYHLFDPTLQKCKLNIFFELFRYSCDSGDASCSSYYESRKLQEIWSQCDHFWTKPWRI